MYMKETNYRQHEKYGTDLHMEMWIENIFEKWDGSTYRNVDGEILETGIRDYL